MGLGAIKLDKLKPETVIYGVLAIALFFWVTKKTGQAVEYVSELSDTYNPLDSDNKVNQAVQSGVLTDVLRYSNPVLAVFDLAVATAKKEYEFLKNLTK